MDQRPAPACTHGAMTVLRDRNLNPPKEKLPPLVKVKLASVALVAVLADRMDEQEAGCFLR